MRVGAFDVVVLGDGMAGVSAAARLAMGGAQVAVLEPEAQPGVHATGRSVAVFTENYGNRPVRLLTVASRQFFDSPPAGFTDVPLLHPRGALWIGRPDQAARVDGLATSGRSLVPNIARVDAAFALERCPALSPSYVAGGVWEPGAADIDVDALLQGYRRCLRAAGGQLLTGARTHAAHRSTHFRLSTSRGVFEAPAVVDAAGAWADQVAAMLGARPVGLQPLRRTAFVFDPPDGGDPSGWPHVIDADEAFYFKPDSGRLIGSPADETPSEPVDARADELDVAVALERIGAAMGAELRHAHRPWAGLRTFAPDRTPVVGPDPEVEGLLWLAGQGGYGIQTAPALAEAAASLVQTGALPAALTAAGLTAAELSPARFGPAEI